MSELTDLIAREELFFATAERKVSFDLGKRKQKEKLVRQLRKAQLTAAQSPDHYFKAYGKGLCGYLQQPEQVVELADVFMSLVGSSAYREKFHISVDIERVDKGFSQEPVYVSLGSKSYAFGEVFPKMTVFEQFWNLTLLEAHASHIRGYPLPKNPQELRGEIAYHAQQFFLGTPRQLQRYEKYAKIKREYRKEILEGLTLFQKRR